MHKTTVLITSEHGGNKVPNDYKYLFENHITLLQTHRGLDIGTLKLAENLKKINVNSVKLFKTDITRLLVDVNRVSRRKFCWQEVPVLLEGNLRIIFARKGTICSF